MLDNIYGLLENIFNERNIGELVHSSFVGSKGKGRIKKDIDIYLVLRELNWELFSIIRDQIARSSIQRDLNILRVEFRRGPFKLDSLELIQIHVLVETLSTLTEGNFMTKRTWARQGTKIAGIELERLLEAISFTKSDILASCKSEIEEMIKGLEDMSIPYREWSKVHGKVKLVNKRKAVKTQLELKEYLKDCVLSSLKHYIEIKWGIGTDSISEIIDHARVLRYEYGENMDYIVKALESEKRIEGEHIELSISMLKDISSFYGSQN